LCGRIFRNTGVWEDGDWLLHLPGLDLSHKIAIITPIVDHQQKIQLHKDNIMLPVINLITSNRTQLQIELDQNLQNFWQHSANYTEHTLNEINNVRFYDQLLCDHTKMRVLDIGANIGLFSLYMHTHAEQIIALEPSPDTFSVLQKLTAPYSNIKCLPLALNYTCGNTEFYINQQNTQMNGFMYQTDQKIVVPTVDLPTLIEQCSLDRVDLLKCDIEGGEMSALTFSKVNAVKDKVRTWFVEVHAVATAHKNWADVISTKRNQLAEIFRQTGYAVEFIKVDGIIARSK
jgi:FkbM family methyltransferase